MLAAPHRTPLYPPFVSLSSKRVKIALPQKAEALLQFTRCQTSKGGKEEFLARLPQSDPEKLFAKIATDKESNEEAVGSN